MKYGLLGRTLGHSYSPMIHKLIGGYEYELFPREPEKIEALLSDPEVGGLNVTIPYKREVIPFLSRLDPLASRLGNVNTVVRNSDGSLWGYNTDYYGFQSLICHSGLSVSGKKVLVLGSGGAASTVIAVLEDLGAKVVMISRNGKNNYENLSLHDDASVIVNATPVGMFPNTGTAPVDISLFSHLEGIFDLIYNPSKTQLLLDGEKMGIPCFNGLWMLVAQAKKAAELFTGRLYPEESIRNVYGILQQNMKNIVLIGMPGCGKTTLGKALASATGKTFADADTAVAQAAGKTIPEIFSQDGEEAFRKLESEVLADLGKQSGLVLSTGGGCVTRPENYDVLRQNGSVFWIQRALEQLPTNGRPLSQTHSAQEIFHVRQPMYAHFSDFSIDNNGTVSDAVEKILQIWEDQP